MYNFVLTFKVKNMLQSTITFAIVLIALCYVLRRLYNSIQKKKECDKCALMDAVKTQNKI
jgi:hypothetical protein